MAERMTAELKTAVYQWSLTIPWLSFADGVEVYEKKIE